jgi:hypothetical protein
MKIKVSKTVDEEVELTLPVFRKWYTWVYAILEDETAIYANPDSGIRITSCDEALSSDKTECTKEEFIKTFNIVCEKNIEELYDLKSKVDAL